MGGEAAGGIISGVSKVVDDSFGNVLAGQQFAADEAYRKRTEEREKELLRMKKEAFDIEKALSMQDVREKERQAKWKADFARYLSLG